MNKEFLYTLDIKNLDDLDDLNKQQALYALEEGKVLYFPTYSFPVTSVEKDSIFNTQQLIDKKHKNLSYDYGTQRMGGIRNQQSPELSALLHAFMKRYAEFAKQLVIELLPDYQDVLISGRTSYRPAEIEGRVYSKRKDDKRIHVDSFPATPVHGRRILRVFCNVNPNQVPRIWELGEPFQVVIDRFQSKIPNYNLLYAKVLHLIKATKTLRSAYDHYQLNLHDNMKLDEQYQKEVRKTRIDFPANSMWIVFTDQVSHAALKGQFVLEQTFYLPIEAMNNPEQSPYKQWEKIRMHCFNKKRLVKQI